MIHLSNIRTFGWESAIYGMRNPKNSWAKSDSGYGCLNRYTDIEPLKCHDCKNNNPFTTCSPQDYILGPNDLDLCKRLVKGGPVHAKFRRMITVYLDITAPLYWWKEFDTYKVGTVANSCSTMHKIQAKEFTLDDFSHEHLNEESLKVLNGIIDALEASRKAFNALEGDEAKKMWWQMIQLLPTSFNQRRTVMMNYEVVANIIDSRENHKLDEWRVLCKYLKINLPYFDELIKGE